MSCGTERPKPQPGTSRSDGRQQRVRPRRHQDEHRRRGRLFERLEQRVLGGRDQRVGLIEDDHTTPAFERAIGGTIDHLADLLRLDGFVIARFDDEHVPVHAARDAGARRARPAGVELDQVELAGLSSRDLRAVFGTTGAVQLTAWAVASAVRRLPTPAGPAKMRLGGSRSRRMDRASNRTTRRCPMTSLNGMDTTCHASYH